MKKSVNGKSFDEIFEQRGKEVQVSEMQKWGIYLSSCSMFRYNWLLEFHSFIPRTLRVEAVDTACLSSDDATFFKNSPEDLNGMLIEELGIVYEATPDQIELLNAYKNESK